MTRKRLKANALWIGMCAVTFGLFLAARPVVAQEELDVKIELDSYYPVPSHSHDHNMTVRALKSRTMEFILLSNPDDSHKVSLTRRQMSDLMDGTTVIILSDMDADGGDYKAHRHRATLTYTGAEEKRSGW